MQKGKVLSLEDRIPKIKEHRKRRANRRLIFLLTLFFLLIVCVVYIQSPLSQINKIEVYGNNLVSKNEITKVSSLKKGDNIWKVNKGQASKKIMELPEVKKAGVRLEFPNNIVIDIKEYSPIALIVSDKEFLPVLENGTILKNSTMLADAPLLINFKKGPFLDELAAQLKDIPSEILNAVSEIHYEPKETDKYHIYIFMNDGFEISATITTLSTKMIHYPSIVSQLDPKVKGVINLEVGSFFKAYDLEEEVKSEEEEER
ncbi:cell division protein FtsQ/DivIB [Lederbergia wuyishanensis]|uniref:Cell division protein DivIB n=1 Tax=Lederbergia wuyishanensis TaxID=1347903 RepID=A0ABU0CZH3_9BACI|nr:FtsQ-type POTRA domain-containing protein [Lederbergia wuyishanensis]MCJ8006181.1 FtsQ-type POTRA domain-containing protein [Lederbergia wuyishanensis]MDQ0341551.1 cell division protein FtsQ [Lederbergia wuyishanensis]